MKMVQSIPKKQAKGNKWFKRSFVYSSQWWDEKKVGLGHKVTLWQYCSIRQELLQLHQQFMAQQSKHSPSSPLMRPWQVRHPWRNGNGITSDTANQRMDSGCEISQEKGESIGLPTWTLDGYSLQVESKKWGFCNWLESEAARNQGIPSLPTTIM